VLDRDPLTLRERPEARPAVTRFEPNVVQRGAARGGCRTIRPARSLARAAFVLAARAAAGRAYCGGAGGGGWRCFGGGCSSHDPTLPCLPEILRYSGGECVRFVGSSVGAG